MDHLDKLESESIFIFREAFHAQKKLAMLWSCGKDSNVMVHLARKSFFGRVPFPVIHCDTGLEFPEVYAFRDRYAKAWKLNLLPSLCPPLEATDASLPAAARVAARKTLGLKEAMASHGLTTVIAGIRRDEEATRAKERIFSLRGECGAWDAKTQPPEFWGYYHSHSLPGTTLRVHPLLNWSELDVWRYIKREKIPVPTLYFARKANGNMMRYRSLGERGITFPVFSEAVTIEAIIAELAKTNLAERSGRPMGADEDESSFERLRQEGYM